MRKIIVLLVICFLLQNNYASFAQTKHALIFAIGNYPDGSGWHQISSNNDTLLLKKALTAQNFRDIKVVHDKDATVKGISKAIELLIDKSKPGDIDVIHFSSHGEQIEDSLRHKADGLEECIVSYDAKWPDPAKKPFTNTYIKSLFPGYYREDMLGAYVNKLRQKLGKNGDLFVSLDLCHAGTGTRGIVKIRGGQDALVTPGFNLKYIHQTDQATAISNNIENNEDESKLAPYTVIGAAMANESDYETIDLETGIGYGSLSYAISKVFLDISREKQNHLTYRTLFSKIQSIINENPTVQHPVLAGNGKDKLVFKDSVISQKTYFTIEKIKRESPHYKRRQDYGNGFRCESCSLSAKHSRSSKSKDFRYRYRNKIKFVYSRCSV